VLQNTGPSFKGTNEPLTDEWDGIGLFNIHPFLSGRVNIILQWAFLRWTVLWPLQKQAFEMLYGKG